jgi:ATP-dependent RNA helicase DDX19/DBP5
MDYTKMFAPDAYTLTLQHHELTVTGIKQMYMDCVTGGQKFDVLVQLYHVLTIGSSIIFVHVCSQPQLPNILVANIAARNGMTRRK